MKIIEKISSKAKNNRDFGVVTIAFLGDSVTQGCFEIYRSGERIEPIYDQSSSYEKGVFDILSTLYPSCPINIINAGISGDNTGGGLARLSRDVISHNPDLCVVCFGLNDCSTEQGSVEKYVGNLRKIFGELEAANIETIFMTPNMMNTEVSHLITDEGFKAIAERTSRMQNEGVFDAHIDGARELCKEMNIALCDCYAIWKRLAEYGANTTELLSNKINHPTRQMNKMFSYELVKTMLEM
jgi:lysophospholipase L1-like esterase